MKDKLKIMFYGNCQLASIGKFFNDNLQNEFEVVSCEECDVIPDTFIKGPTFSLWQPENNKRQSELCDCILSLCSKVDVFVFQSHSGSQWIDNLKTEYICNNILKENSMHICVPDCRFMVHTTNFHILKPWIEYAKEIHTDSNQIIDFLKNSDDPHLLNLFQNEYPYSEKFVPWRNDSIQKLAEDSEKYQIRLNMNNFFLDNFENKILMYDHCHPIQDYYFNLIAKILNVLDIDDKQINQMPLEIRGGNAINPEQFRFFRTQFPKIDYSTINGREITIEDLDG